MEIKKFMKIYRALLIIVLCVLFLSGCERAKKDTQVVFTRDFEADEVFRIDRLSCRIPEINVYMRTSLDQYESVFGEQIWDRDIQGESLQQLLKDTILSRLAQIKVMKLLAVSRGLELSEEEDKEIADMADEFLGSLKEEEIAELGVDRDIIINMYSEYFLANKVYEDVTKDVNPEISDDEARIIKVKHILIKNYDIDWNGNKRPLSISANKAARKKIQDIKDMLDAGEDFDKLAEKYNEDDETNYSFGKNTMPRAFEDAAFDLAKDEISDIVETDYGYHIIKCVSTFDRDETDANKLKILQQRKNDAFNQVYGEFVATLYSNFNEKLWDSMDFQGASEVTTTNFFDIYNEHLQEN